MITTHPQDTNACVGATVTLRVETNGPVFSYQWRKNAIEIFGETSDRLTFASAQFSDSGVYDVIVRNTCVTLLSDTALLVVVDRPVINEHPQSQSLCAQDPLLLSVSVDGAGLRYQWYKDGLPLSSATQPTYAVRETTASDTGMYFVRVSNACATLFSDPATVFVQQTILIDPVSQTVCVNDPLIFTVTASGTSLLYQWRKDGVEIPGATANFFVIQAAQTSDSGAYDVVVTSPSCVQTSASAMLTVRKCP